MEYHFEDIKRKLLDEIEKSEFLLFCAVAWITDFDIIDSLVKAAKRGVRVEVLMNDDDRYKRNEPRFQKLLDSGGRIFLYPSKQGELMHHKFCIIDLTIVINGSFNWTYAAATKHEENITIVRGDIKASKDFSRQFNRIKKTSVMFSSSNESYFDLAHYVDVTNVVSMGAGPTFDEPWSLQLHLREDEKYTVLSLEFDNFFESEKVKPPKQVFGYWKGHSLFDLNAETKWYEFECLDPNLIKYIPK